MVILTLLGQTQWLTSQARLLTAPLGPPKVAAFSGSLGNLPLRALRPGEGGERLRADWLQHLSWPLEATVLASFCESHSVGRHTDSNKMQYCSTHHTPMGSFHHWRYNLHIMLCKFKVYNVMIRDTGILRFSALHSLCRLLLFFFTN